MTNDMNPTPEDEQLWLDKLVDGELDATERRQLLLELESQPDGWRRCALAFLEAQAWKQSLGAMVAAPAKEASPRPAIRSAHGRSFSWGTLLAAAASFLVAFALGQTWRGQADRPDEAAVARSAPAVPAEQPAAKPRQPELGFAADQPQWGTMTVALDRNNDGIAEQLELPVAHGPGVNEEWLRNLPAPIPSEILRDLQQRGHRVEHERRYLPFDLGDGGRVLVPMDEVDVRFVGERQFQ